MKRNNKGQISVYVCALLCVFLLLIATVLQGIRIWEGKAKCSQSVAGAVDSIKGDYQPDLFRRYHLFALDKTYYGRGEGYLEERAKEYLEYNLSPGDTIYDYQVKDVMLTDTTSLLDDNLSRFKQQIQDYMELKLPISIVEEVWNSGEQESIEEQQQILEREWTTLSDSANTTDFSLDELENITMEDICALGVDEISDVEQLEYALDPRKAIEDILQRGILYTVMPEQAMSISQETIELDELPSVKASKNSVLTDWINPFPTQGLQQLTQWDMDQELLNIAYPTIDTQEIYGITYALDSFQYAGHTIESDSEDYHALDYEVEYLIAGKDSDYENMSEVAEQLCTVRFIPNAAYAFTNESMKNQALLVSALILTPLGLLPMAESVSYVMLACWAYGESMLDVKTLLEGETVPLIKDKDTWQLSITGIMDIAVEEVSGSDAENGLNYEAYLMLLLATMPDADVKYYRMLDLMQLNIQKEIPEFRISNCICGFQLQVEVEEGDYVWYMEEEGSYLIAE